MICSLSVYNISATSFNSSRLLLVLEIGVEIVLVVMLRMPLLSAKHAMGCCRLCKQNVWMGRMIAAFSYTSNPSSKKWTGPLQIWP